MVTGGGGVVAFDPTGPCPTYGLEDGFPRNGAFGFSPLFWSWYNCCHVRFPVIALAKNGVLFGSLYCEKFEPFC